MPRFELEVKTPIHIGSGKTWSSFSDFINVNKKVYILDSEKIFDYLMDYKIGKKGKITSFAELKSPIDEYLDTIKGSGNEKGNINQIIESYFDEKDIQKGRVSDKFIKNYTKTSINLNGTIKNTDIQEHIKSGKRIYIPGTSLKGAIRTALLHNENKDKTYVNEKVFGKNVNEDEMKYLLVGDTGFAQNESISIEKIQVTQIKKKEKSSLPIVCECISNGNYEFKIKTKGINSKFSYLNEEKEIELLKLVDKFYRERLESELKELENSMVSKDLESVIIKYRKLLEEAKENEYLIRVGANKTFYDQSISDLLSDEEFKELNLGNREDFPITRKFILDKRNKPINICGWAVIRRVEE